MSDQQSKTKQATQPKLQGEHLGVVLFLIGVLPLVLVGVAFFKGQVPGETQARGLAAAALRLVRAFGYFPSLVLFGGVSAVGAVLFLGNRLLAPGRHLLGLVGVSLGLAALLGSVQHLGGGRIGDALGGSLGRSMGPWAGVVVGVLIMGATAVLAWFGGSVPMPKKLGKGATLSTALSDLDRDGVSNAETHALAPDASTLKYMEELWRGTKPVVQVVPLPPSPYPEDVRLKGKIPEGASALPVAPKDAAKQPAEATPKEATESSDAVSANQSQGKPQGKHAAHRWDRGAKESAPEHPVDSDLGPDDLEDAVVGAPSVLPVAADDHASPDDPFGLHSPEELALAELIGLEPGQTKVAEVRELPPGTRALPKTPPAGSGEYNPNQPPRPVWERESVEEPPQNTDSQASKAVGKQSDPSAPAAAFESEDSVATPESDEALGKLENDWLRAWEAAAVEADALEEVEAELGSGTEGGAQGALELEEEVEVEASDEEESEDDLEEGELDEDEEYEEEDEDDDSLETAEDEDEDAEDEDDEEDEESEYEEYEDEDDEDEEESEDDEEESELEDSEEELEEVEEDEPQTVAQALLSEEAEEEDEEEEEEYELDEDEEYEDEDEDEDEESEDDEESEYEEEEEDDEEGEEEVDEDEDYEEEEEEDEEAAELEEDEEEEEGEEDEEPEEEESELEEEPEFEIQPEPSAKASGPRSARWSHAKLVREAGAFLIQRNRVGVSMLQREFELEFEVASELLDEFEQVGLIGPYMGGQKRAILLDLDAWLERSPSA